ncbi:NAD(P)-binding domain-containing protein [Kallotenue papyrolyticum]|uniref:NAD(P)-binding domain-containing protein n=1 Tax=Kallotenue papyrolyticum TaxID=1325125 RepID=UPI000492CDC1|nr:NAD(P)-binding domain-containing protein [Kallotenue papyrolyticum]
MARILVIGSGVVGQATGKGFAKKGHAVSYVDINPDTIARLCAEGLTAMPIHKVDWLQVDVVMLAVSTPSVDGRIVLDYIEAAALDVGHGLARTDQFVAVVVRSTVPPTTTVDRLTPIMERASGKRAGRDFGVAMNPEFLRAVSSEQDFARPWITVLGCSDRQTAELLDQLYAPFGALIVRCTPTEAEMIKYVNNVYNALKISYFNEVHAICERLGLDSALVGAAVARSAEGMWNPLYGTRGGVPYGGACLPKDTVAFLQFVRERGFEHLMLEATIAVNERLAQRVPPASSLAQLDAVLEAVRLREAAAMQGLDLPLELPQPQAVVL